MRSVWRESTLPTSSASTRVTAGPGRAPERRAETRQFTDDTQMMLLVAGMLADGTYSEQGYAAALARMYMNEDLRFPDGAVDAACRGLLLSGERLCGVASNTAGCISISIPFALVYDDLVDVTERVVQACSVTHTHPAAHAGAVTVAILVHHASAAAPTPSPSP